MRYVDAFGEPVRLAVRMRDHAGGDSGPVGVASSECSDSGEESLLAAPNVFGAALPGKDGVCHSASLAALRAAMASHNSWNLRWWNSESSRGGSNCGGSAG